MDSSECQSSNKITDGVFPTSGSTIPSWTTTGSFALNARGLQYDADNTVNSVRQNVSSVFSGSTINLNNVRWLTTNNTSAGRLITEILYGGTVYATIDTGIGVAGSIPTVTGNNGAVTNISTLPSIASTGVYSTPSNLMITLPQTFASSGEFQIRFTTTSGNSDDISIESVQLISCSDFDGDGIPNYLDLDSDGDGCPDAIEGSGNFNPSTTASGTLTTQSPNINFGIAVDANGIPTTVGASGQGIGDSLDTVKDCKDSDGDGYPDWQDLDDDNDGILDCVENGLNTTLDKIFKANNNATLIASPSTGPANQYRLTNATSQNGQIWSYGKVDFTKSFSLPMKALLSDADGIAIVFHNSPAGQLAGGTNGQGLGARGIANGIALELDTFQNGCNNDANNGENCDPNFDHGSIRTTAGWINAGKLAGDTQLGDGTVDDGSWHNVVINWNAATRNLSYTFDGVPVTNYTFPTTGANAIETILGGNSAYFGFTASTGGAGSNNSVGFDDLCALPLTLDSDNDGISNHLDLDSDGDGCSDAREGAGNFNPTTTASGTISTQNPNQNFGIDVDSNGVPTLAGASGQGVGQSQDIGKNDCIDSDGDGYPDWQDLDDDNDGILDTVECSVTDLVTNGTFTGNANGWTLENSWTYNTNRVANSADGETSRLLQSISNLNKLSGNIIPLTFTVGAQDASNASGNTSALEIRLNGALYATINNATSRDNSNVTITLEPGVMSNFTTFGTSAVNGYTTQTFTLWIPYTGPSTANLVFRKVGGNDDWSIDNVSIPAMICDTDGDGILDHLDLDSDGDGCTDTVEGAGSFTTSQLTTASGTISTQNPNQNFGIDVDSNGVPKLAGASGQGVGQSQDISKNDCLDSDNDGVPNWLDLDSDNDGILDIDENCTGFLAQNTNGTWKGDTNSNLTVNLGTSTTQTDSNSFNDGKHYYYVNNSGAERRYVVSGNFNNFTYTFSTPVKAKEIAFYLTDIDPGGSLSSSVSFKVNGGSPNGKFTSLIVYGLSATDPYLNYNPITGVMTHDGTNNQRILLKGQGDSLVSSITINSTNINSGDSVAFSLFALKTCDTDQDGISNDLDLDSDGDGCPDAIEGDAAFTTSNLVNSSMPGGNTGGSYTGTAGPVSNNLGNTVGNTPTTMGVPNIAGTGQGVGGSRIATNYSQCLDSDGDGYPDWQDLDDDNDGILDTAEICKSAISTDFFGGQTSTVTTVSGANVVPTTATITPAITNYYIGWHYNDATGAVGKEMSINFSNPVYFANDNIDFSLGGLDNGSSFGNFFVVYEDGVRLSNLDFSLTNITGDIITSTINGAKAFNSGAGPNSTGSLTLNGIDRTKRIIKMGYTVHALNGSSIITSENIRPRIQIDCDMDGDGIPNQLDLDSDGDGCPDAIEGAGNFNPSTTASGTLSTQTPNINFGTTVDANGVPTVVGASGQAVGDAQNASVNSQCSSTFCYKPGILDAGNTYPTNHGITALGRAGAENDNWPMVRQSAWTVLEAKTKGFVVNRVANPTTDIANPVEGMMVFDTTAQCLKIYNGTVWSCYSTPACP